MNFCLSDLVPPLRWSDASTITLLTGQPDLPDAWWRSLPMPHVLTAIGPEPLGELLTEIALEHWPAAAVGDILPALHVLDPEEADEPAVAIALDRAGSWAGLLAMTSRQLVDQPFVKARPVLNTLFTAVLARLAHPVRWHAPAPAETDSAADASAAHEAPLPLRESPDAGEHALGEEPSPAAAAFEPMAAEPAAEPVAYAGEPVAEPSAESSAESFVAESQVDGPPVEGPAVDERAVDERAPVEGALAAHAFERPAFAESPYEEPAQDGRGDAFAARFAAPEGVEAQEGVASHEGAPEHRAAEPAGPAGVPDAEAQAEVEHEAEAHAEAVADAVADAGAEAGLEASDEARVEAGVVERAPEYETADEPEPVHAAAPEPAASGAQPEEEPEEEPSEHPLPELIEAAFAGLDDKSWAVAQNRIFTDDPSAVDQLAKLFAVPPAEITATEYELRTRLDQWLASDEAAPYRAHLDELRRTLGPAAPKEQLVGAADWHSVEIRALEVPAWQFVLATLPPQPELPPPPLPRRKPPAEAQSAFGPVQTPPPGLPQFQAFTPVTPAELNGDPEDEADKPYQPLKDVSQTRRCFRQPDGRWWLRIDVTAEQLGGGECPLPTGFASYLGLSPGETRTVRSAAGELTMAWHGRPVLQSIERLLVDVGAREGGHLFLTLSDEGVLRARHLPVAAQGAEQITKALRLVGYTAPGGTRDQAARVIATRIGMTGPVSLPELFARLRERGDRDLLALLD